MYLLLSFAYITISPSLNPTIVAPCNTRVTNIDPGGPIIHVCPVDPVCPVCPVEPVGPVTPVTPV